MLCLPMAFRCSCAMALTTVEEFETRIASLDVAINRMSSLLDSMLPYPPRSQSEDTTEFEREEIMSDLSDDETVVYYNQYDFGDVDEETDDQTFVPPWEKPYYDTDDVFVTPPAIQQPAEPPRLYRPNYLDLAIYEDEDHSL